jgi:hypothetical protein
VLLLHRLAHAPHVHGNVPPHLSVGKAHKHLTCAIIAIVSNCHIHDGSWQLLPEEYFPAVRCADLQLQKVLCS